MSDAERDREPESDEEFEPLSLTPDLASGLSRRQLSWETAAVLALAVLPDWYSCFAGYVWPHPTPLSVPQAALLHFVYAIQICVPVCYLISRSGERWSDFGIARPRWLLDPLLALGVWICDVAFQQSALRMAGAVLNADQFETLTSNSDYMFPVARTPGEHLLLAGSLTAISFSEELVMRGYLLRRFEQWTGSSWLSVLITSLLFASYHAYQGPYGVFHAFIAGLNYAGAFCVFRRLWPVAIAHTLWNWAASFGG